MERLSSEDKEAKGTVTALEEVVLQNSNQLYRWHTELEAARTLETEEKYRRYADTLSGHLASCDGLLEKVSADSALCLPLYAHPVAFRLYKITCSLADGCHYDSWVLLSTNQYTGIILITAQRHVLMQVEATLKLFDMLKAQHHNVSGKTRTLHDSCERLVDEKDKLAEFAEALRAKLAYFDELERLATQFHSGTMSVDVDNFLPVLHRLDECITWAVLSIPF